MKDQRFALEIPRGDLSLAVCENCGFVFNQAFEPSKMSYGGNYDNTQSCSLLFDEYLSNLARNLDVEKGVKNSRVIEVGCGKGLFLRKLIEIGGNMGYRFDSIPVMSGRTRTWRVGYTLKSVTVVKNVLTDSRGRDRLQSRDRTFARSFGFSLHHQAGLSRLAAAQGFL